MKNLLLFGAIMCLLSSCAITPPPKITDTSYENYKYEFSVEIPKNWKAVNVKDIKDFLPLSDLANANAVKAAFINHNTESLIMVRCDKTFLNPDLLVFIKDEKLREGLTDQYEKYKKDVGELTQNYNGNLENFEYEIKKVRCYDGPCLISVASFNITSDSEKSSLEQKLYYYRCNNDDLCSIEFVISTRPEYYQASLADFATLTNSLIKGVVAAGSK